MENLLINWSSNELHQSGLDRNCSKHQLFQKPKDELDVSLESGAGEARRSSIQRLQRLQRDGCSGETFGSKLVDKSWTLKEEKTNQVCSGRCLMMSQSK